MQAIIAAALWHDSNTSHVIVKPPRFPFSLWLFPNSNTSHVIVKHILKQGWHLSNTDSNTSHVIVKHAAHYPVQGIRGEFKYIPCYS